MYLITVSGMSKPAGIGEIRAVDGWKNLEIPTKIPAGVQALSFYYIGIGKIELKEFEL